METVRKLIVRLAPEAVCDACVAEKLALRSTDDASRAARELAGTDGIERRRDTCSLCGSLRTITRKAGA